MTEVVAAVVAAVVVAVVVAALSLSLSPSPLMLERTPDLKAINYSNYTGGLGTFKVTFLFLMGRDDEGDEGYPLDNFLFWLLLGNSAYLKLV